MTKQLFPEGVEVHQTALRNQVREATFQTQRRSIDLSSGGGRVTGLALTVGTPTYVFDFEAGHGYSDRGDIIEYDGVVGQGLNDYTLGAENLFVLLYREEATTTEAHESSGTSQATEVLRSSELQVMSRTEYNALLAAFDADLETDLNGADVSTNAANRALILAVVLGKGFTGPTPNGYVDADFTNGNITQASLAPLIGAALEYPTPFYENIGINLRSITQNTPTGIGTLELITNSASDRRLRWTAPGDAAGAQVAITLTNLVDTVTLESSTTDYSLVVDVVPEMLFPAAGIFVSPLSMDVTVAVLADQGDAPIFSAKDAVHRGAQGSSPASSTDPHGTAVEDLVQQAASLPRSLVLGSGISTSLIHGTKPRILSTSSAASTRTLQWEIYGANGSTRLYSSTNASELVHNARWVFDGTTYSWTPDNIARPSRFEQHDFSTGFTVVYTRTAGAGTWTVWPILNYTHAWATGDFTASQNLEAGNDLNVTGDASVGNILTVSNDANINDALIVGGVSALNGNVSAGADLSVAGDASVVGDTESGTLTLTTAAPGTPVANRAYSDSLIKAWATLSYDGVTTTATILDSFNISTVVAATAQVQTVTFATALTNGNYAVVGSTMITSGSIAQFGIANLGTKGAASFQFLISQGLSAVNTALGSAYVVHFIVTGA